MSFLRTFSHELALWLGIAVELIALCLIPLVVLRRKEPSSTAAWILALVFVPVIGSVLFLLFGRDRVRWPVKWKRDADKALARRVHKHRTRLSLHAREAALARLEAPVDKELFRIGVALGGAEPTDGNAVELLVDGEATYAAMGRAIDGALYRIYAEYYLIRRDETAAWFRDRLVAAARRGVEVKLLVDGYGSFWLNTSWVRPLVEAGAEFAFFLPARLILFQPMNLRNHRKIVVIDGEVAFTGGINIGDEYKGAFGPWRDMHLALRGPAAQDLVRVFEQDWHFATNREIANTEEAPSEVRHRRKLSSTPPVRGEHGDAHVAIIRSGPDIEGTARETIHRIFFSAITIARSRVFITTPYFIPDRAIVVALETAALRGVDVRLLVPSKSNHPFVSQAGRSFYEELLEAGVRIYEYGPGMIHAKTLVVDGTMALVGSANMDLRSFRLNFEVHAVIRDDTAARALEALFEIDLARSKRVELQEFKNRPRALRVVEGAARLLSPLM